MPRFEEELTTYRELPKEDLCCTSFIAVYPIFSLLINYNYEDHPPKSLQGKSKDRSTTRSAHLKGRDKSDLNVSTTIMAERGSLVRASTYQNASHVEALTKKLVVTVADHYFYLSAELQTSARNFRGTPGIDKLKVCRETQAAYHRLE